jgi:hypothetical protein
LLTKILKMEEEHVNWAEMQRAQIDQIGLQEYLSRQTKGASSWSPPMRKVDQVEIFKIPELILYQILLL